MQFNTDNLLLVLQYFIISIVILIFVINVINRLTVTLLSDIIDNAMSKPLCVLFHFISMLFIGYSVYKIHSYYYSKIIDSKILIISALLLQIIIAMTIVKAITKYLFKQSLIKNNIITVYLFLPLVLLFNIIFSLFIPIHYCPERISFISDLVKMEYFYYKRDKTWVNVMNKLIKLNILFSSISSKDGQSDTGLYEECRIKVKDTIGRAISQEDLIQKLEFFKARKEYTDSINNK